MHSLDVLGDPVRRRILVMLVDGELSAGEIAAAIRDEFGISQPAVSQHLKVLREHGFATVRPEGTRRLYAVDPHGPQEASQWLSPFERFWRPRLDALGTELARGRRQRRLAVERAAEDPPPHP
jgi:DNA-binding transcriptional ArsR family regulator